MQRVIDSLPDLVRDLQRSDPRFSPDDRITGSPNTINKVLKLCIKGWSRGHLDRFTHDRSKAALFRHSGQFPLGALPLALVRKGSELAALATDNIKVGALRVSVHFRTDTSLIQMGKGTGAFHPQSVNAIVALPHECAGATWRRQKAYTSTSGAR